MGYSRFDESQPILRDVAVASRAPGKKAIAETLDSAAQKALEVGGDLAKEASSSMYLASQANINELKINSLINMQQHPDHAEEFAKATATGIDSITSNAYVNKDDRSKLKYAASLTNDELLLKAGEITSRNSKIQAKALIYSNLPANLKILQDSAINNHELFAHTSEAMMNQWQGALKSEVVSGIEYANTMKTIGDIIDRATMLHRDIKNSPEGMSAVDYHKATGSILNTNTSDNSHEPINETTRYLQQNYSEEMDEKAAISDISQGKIPNPQLLMSLPKNAFKTVYYNMQGMIEAQSNIRAGEPMPQILSRVNELSSKDRVLNNRESGELQHYNYFISRMKAGDYVKIIADLPGGGAIAKNYTDNVNALDGLLRQAKDPEDIKRIQTQKFQNYNNYVNNNIALGESRHYPFPWVQPIPKEIVNSAQLGFEKDKDPYQTLRVLDMHSKWNQPYLAAAMKNTSQQETMQAVSLMRHANTGISESDQAKWIAANQDGRDFSLLKLGTKNEGMPEKLLLGKIVTGLAQTKILSYTGKQPTGDISTGYNQLSTNRNAGLLNSIVNRVKYEAMANQDYKLEKADVYIDKALSDVKKSYQIIQGTNYQFNKNEMPFNESDAPFVAEYALNEAYKNFHRGKSEAEFRLSLDRNPFTVTMTRDHRLIAMDNSGNVVFDQLYTNKILSSIRIQKKEEEKNNKKELPQVEF